MKKYDVFISYKSEEYKEAKKVKDYLEESGVNCWMAPDSITGGQSYANEIANAIKNSQFFILILSEKSHNSKEVLRELKIADDTEGCTIMPFAIEKVNLEGDMLYFLSIIQHYEAFFNHEKALEDMVTDIRKVIPQKEEVSVPEDVKTPQKKQIKPEVKAKIKKVLIVVGMIVLLILAGGLLRKSSKIEIAGETFERDTTRISLKGVELTKEDLAKIKKLEDVNFYSLQDCVFPTDDLSGIFNHNARYLYLDYCNLTNEQVASIGLNDYQELEGLGLSGCKTLTEIQNGDYLGSSIRYLYLSETGIRDFSFLNSYRYLSTLYICNNELESLDFLSSCNDLVLLNIYGNKISSLEPLRGCDELETLNAGMNYIMDFTGLEQSIRLSFLCAEDCYISSLAGLENATILESVYLGGNALSDASTLAKSSGVLKYVNLEDNNLTDLKFLEKAEHLRYLNVDQNQIETLVSLEACINLEGLSAQDNLIADVNGLQNHKTLSYLDLSDNQIKQISPIAAVGPGQNMVMDLSNNQIDNLYLVDFYHYHYLDVRGNNINSLFSIKNSDIDQLIFDYYDGVDLEQLKNGEYGYISVLNCPLDKRLEVEEQLGKYNTYFDMEEALRYLEDYIPWQLAKKGRIL